MTEVDFYRYETSRIWTAKRKAMAEEFFDKVKKRQAKGYVPKVRKFLAALHDTFMMARVEVSAVSGYLDFSIYEVPKGWIFNSVSGLVGSTITLSFMYRMEEK